MQKSFPCDLALKVEVKAGLVQGKPNLESVRFQPSAKGALVCEVSYQAGCRELADAVLAWVASYAQKKNPLEKLPIKFENDFFAYRALNVVRKIPFGQAMTYQEVAKHAGSPKAARAAGSACASNCLPLFIPCHRVIRSDGSLGGFAYDLKIKQMLLDFERS